MQENQQSKSSKPAKKRKHRVLISISVVVLILLLLIIFVLPGLVSSQAGKNLILSKVNGSLDQGQLNFSKLSMSWLNGIKVNDITYKENESQQVVRIERLATKPNYASFLLGSASFGQTSMVFDGNDQKNPALTAKSNGWTLKNTTGDLEVELDGLVLGSLQPLLNMAKMDVKAAGTVTGKIVGKVKDGQIENLTANIDAKNLDVTLPAESQKKPQQIKADFLKADVKLKQEKENINIESLNIKTDWADASAAGLVPMSIAAMSDFLKPDSPYKLKVEFNCDLAKVMSQTVGLAELKDDIKIVTGKIAGNIDTYTTDGKKNIAGQVTLSDLSGNVSGKQVALSKPIKAEVDIMSDEKQIVFEKLNVSSSFCNINCTGPMDNLTYKSSADLAMLQSELGQFVDMAGYQLQGQATEQGNIAISEDKIVVTSTAQITNLNIKSPQGLTASEPKTDITFAGAMDIKKSIFTAEQFKVDAGFGQLNLKDIVLPLDEKDKTNTTMKLSAKSLDLAKLQQFAKLSGALPDDMQMAGIAQVDVAVDAKNSNYHVVTNNVQIKNLIISSPQQQPFEQPEVSLVFDGYIDPVAGTIEVRNLQLTSQGINIKGNFDKTIKNDQVKLQGKIDGEYDWQAVSAMASPFMPAGLKMAGQRNATINFASQYPVSQPDKLMGNMNTKAAFGFDNAQYMGLNFGQTDLNIKIENGLLTLVPFTSEVNKGQLNFGGVANFNQTPSVFKIDKPTDVIKNVRIDDAVTESLLQYLNPIFANAVNVQGVANLSCQTLIVPIDPADVKNLKIQGTVSVTQMQLEASDLLGQILALTGSSGRQTVTIHPTNFTVKDGFLRYDNMQIDVGSSPLIFKGVIGIEDKSLAMDINVQGVTLTLKGTVDKPKLDTGKIIEKQIEQEILKGLDRFLK